jgi:hypothetical protein
MPRFADSQLEPASPQSLAIWLVSVMLRDYVRLNRTFLTREPFSTRTKAQGLKVCLPNDDSEQYLAVFDWPHLDAIIRSGRWVTWESEAGVESLTRSRESCFATMCV